MIRSSVAVLAVCASTLIGMQHDEGGTEKVVSVRREYEKDVASALLPIRRQYLASLEKLEADLTRQGDLTGATAAKTERHRLMKEGTPSEWISFAGRWVMQYDNGVTRSYDINLDGSVSWSGESDGKGILSLSRKGGDVVLDHGKGKVERLSMTISSEIYYDDAYPAGRPNVVGRGARSDEVGH